MTEGAIFAVMALGLNVIWGWAGDFDLAFYGYVALGAYMTMVLTIGAPSPPSQYILGLKLPYPVGVAGGTVAAMIMGLIVGLIALRHLREIYFAIVTLGAVYVLYVLAGHYTPLFNGFNGLSGLLDPMGNALGLNYNSYGIFFLFLCLAVFVAVYLLVERMSASRFGLALRSVREDEHAAAAFGRDIYRMKLQAYVLGAGLGGLAGGLFAAYLTAFNPSAWTPIETVVLYAAVFVGGKGNNKGVVLGVVLVNVLFQESTRFLPSIPGHPSYAPAIREIVIGAVIILFLRFRPQGLIPERRLVDRGAESGPAPGVLRRAAMGVAASRAAVVGQLRPGREEW
ncbi:MAG TPA: branched-chain amino acid ABC transporter permease [Acidimicrobiales bacterium]|nr:branched-chain amino acid ABC transporter permease [Acidimicrobiales bacterium]